MGRFTAIRVITTIIIVTALFLETLMFFHTLAAILILVLLIFDLFEKTHSDDTVSEIGYYLSWTSITLVMFFIRGSYFGPYTPIFMIAIINALMLLCHLVKYRSPIVIRTILTKTSLLILALYCLELLLNTTHALANLAFIATLISSFELVLIVLIEKRRIPFKSTVFNYLLKLKT